MSKVWDDPIPKSCGLGICAANAGHEGSCAEASGWAEQSDLDALERLAGRLRDRSFPKLAPIVRSDLVLKSADAIDALVARVREAEAERDLLSAALRVGGERDAE